MADMLQNILDSVSSFLSGGGDPVSIRDSILGQLPSEEPVTEPKQSDSVRQPVEPAPDAPLFEGVEAIDVPDFADAVDKNETLASFSPVDFRATDQKKRDAEKKQQMVDNFPKMVKENKLAVKKTTGQASREYIQFLGKTENPNDKGFVKDAEGGKYHMFKSIEGTGTDKANSEYEIGWGIKVPKSWLSNDKSKWPVIDGVRVNIREGLTKQQNESFMRQTLVRNRKVSKKTLKKWDGMTEQEKHAWIDLTYNGGLGAINKNPKAKAAANAGHTMEGLFKTLDFIKGGGKKYRGLLKRRLNMYNKAALSVTGAPIIEEYTWGQEVKAKLSSQITSDKFSDEFKKKVNKSDGWIKVTSGPKTDQAESYKADNYEFTI